VRLSVIIPALNEAARLPALLEALHPLRLRGCEVLVVDGGSTDGTVEVARPLADRVVSAPRGRAAQMNAGAALARGEVLLFLHADCALPADADRAVEQGFAASGKCWGRFDVQFSGTAMLCLVSAAMNLRSRWTRIATGDQAIFVRREAFDAAGRYPDIPLMEDVALSKALKRLGPPLCLRERVLASGRRWEKHGVLRTILLMWRLRLAYALGADPRRLAPRYAPHDE
jgi:rSAM/selenodomain-associated transferase 2